MKLPLSWLISVPTGCEVCGHPANLTSGRHLCGWLRRGIKHGECSSREPALVSQSSKLFAIARREQEAARQAGCDPPYI